MIKIYFKEKRGIIWFPITDDSLGQLKPDNWLTFNLDNTLNEIHKQIGMSVRHVGSNYIVCLYDETTFKDLPDGEYTISSFTGRNVVHHKWLLHLGRYYTEPILKDIKTLKKDSKEIKSFV